MKNYRTNLCCFSIALLCGLLWGCATNRLVSSSESSLASESGLLNKAPLKRDQSGAERIFTNANVVAWVPLRALRVWDGKDGSTSGIQIDEITSPGAFIKDYKINVEIQIATEREFEVFSKGPPDWYFQEHPTLSMKDVTIGKQLRKDIRDPQRGRILLINAMVKRNATFEEDVETAKKIIESIKLIPK